MTIGGEFLEAGDHVRLWLNRDFDEPQDTCTGDLYILGMDVRFAE